MIYCQVVATLSASFGTKLGVSLLKLFTTLPSTKTNTFPPFLTGMQNFEQTYLVNIYFAPLAGVRD